MIGRIAALMTAPFTILACVPATAEQLPRGGVDIRFEGTPATKKTPFVTDDGWTVTVDSFAARVAAFGLELDGYARAPTQVVSVTSGCHMVLRQIVPEPALVSVALSPPIFNNPPYTYPAGDGPPCATEPATLARFGQRADDAFFSGRDAGPTIVLFAHASKDGTTKRVELGIAPAQGATLTLEVKVNEGVPAIFTLDAGALFRLPDGTTAFAHYAAADRDGDDVVTGAEAGYVGPSCFDPSIGPAPTDPPNCDALADRLAKESRGILLSRP